MIDDGSDLNRWLRAGQMTSSGGGVMRSRAQNYRSITQWLWKPYSDHKTNSMTAIAEYKSHTHTVFVFVHVRVQDVLDKTTAVSFFFWKNKTKRGQRV